MERPLYRQLFPEVYHFILVTSQVSRPCYSHITDKKTEPWRRLAPCSGYEWDGTQVGPIPIRPMGSEGGRSDGKNEEGSNLRLGSRREKNERVERVGGELRGVIRELVP